MVKLSPENPYCNSEYSGFTFEERSGDPDTFSCGIGRIILNFSVLDSALDIGISKCLRLDMSLGRIVTSELSFKVKVHMLSSLVRHLASSIQFNIGEGDAVTSWNHIVSQCHRAEELRNQVVHSQWSGAYLRDLKASRRKFSAKSSRGLAENVEIVDSARLLDIADYIITASVYVEEFFMEPIKDKLDRL